MSNVYRICPKCGSRTNEIERRFCPDCGSDSHAELSINESSLTVAASKAAVPLLVGATSLALRFGWKLIQSRVAMSAVHNANTLSRISSPSSKVDRADSGNSTVPKRSGRRIHIRSAWAVGDSKGNWQKGESEQFIDIDE